MVFKRKEAAKGSSGAVVKKSPPSIISSDLHIVGDIDGDGEVHIEGRVDGNIRCETLTIGEGGKVEGKIVASSLRLLGSVTGSVRARFVSMMRSANMIGDVTHERVEIEAGAMVDGLYKHLKAEDFEKRAERFKDVSPPELPKGPVAKPADTKPAETGATTKADDKAKALH